MSKIIVPTDFTKAADVAVKQALVIALKAHAELVLLHVVDAKSPIAEASEKMLKTEVARISEEYGMQCSYMIKTGNVLDVIISEINETSYDLMVIGTHGSKGFRQTLFGSDILNLVSKVPLPVLVVQEKTKVTDNFNKIILPVSSHDGFMMVVNAVLYFAGLFNSEIHLYSISKPRVHFTEKMENQINATMNIFNNKNVSVLRIKEDPNVYSFGYARQTIKYAISGNADVVCMMSVPSSECSYFAKADKESMVTNDASIPVLFAGGIN